MKAAQALDLLDSLEFLDSPSMVRSALSTLFSNLVCDILSRATRLRTFETFLLMGYEYVVYLGNDSNVAGSAAEAHSGYTSNSRRITLRSVQNVEHSGYVTWAHCYV
jgi:hypothetical protein